MLQNLNSFFVFIFGLFLCTERVVSAKLLWQHSHWVMASWASLEAMVCLFIFCALVANELYD